MPVSANLPWREKELKKQLLHPLLVVSVGGAKQGKSSKAVLLQNSLQAAAQTMCRQLQSAAPRSPPAAPPFGVLL